MNASEFLAELGARGITIRYHGDRLQYSPSSVVTPELASQLKAHKAALLAILAHKDRVGTPEEWDEYNAQITRGILDGLTDEERDAIEAGAVEDSEHPKVDAWKKDKAADDNEAHWRAITQADRDYLLGPRNWPAPCSWCGGRLVHRAACDELRRDWVPIVQFGRHRGRRVDELPADYIDWILSRNVGNEGSRDELRRWRETN